MDSMNDKNAGFGGLQIIDDGEAQAERQGNDRQEVGQHDGHI